MANESLQHDRLTNDYSPCKIGSREHNAAINERRHMLNMLATQKGREFKPSKLWGTR